GVVMTEQQKLPSVRAQFNLVSVSQALVILVDCDTGVTITNDAEAVVAWLDAYIDGGIGPRLVFYRDTAGRFDQLQVRGGRFGGFKPGTSGQQVALSRLVERALARPRCDRDLSA